MVFKFLSSVKSWVLKLQFSTACIVVLFEYYTTEQLHTQSHYTHAYLNYYLTGDSCNADLPSPPNGIVQVSNTQYGLVAIYRCDDTSLPLVTRNCLSNSSWSGMAPFCPCKPPTCSIIISENALFSALPN